MIALLLASLPWVGLPRIAQEPDSIVPPFDVAREVTSEVLEQEIDRSLHWLRTRYDPAEGRYGTLEEDAWALLALATSPRQYRPSEGPFLDKPLANLIAAQKEDGSFGDEATTRIAARALAAVGHGARARLAPGGITTPDWQTTGKALEGEAHWREKAKGILSERRPDGSFGSLVDTAGLVEQLSWCHGRLRAREPKKGPRGSTALPKFDGARRAQVVEALGRAAAFLLEQRVEGGWGFGGHRDAGITAMAVGALLSAPEPRPVPVEEAISEGLDYLTSLQKEDGSIHEGQLANYVTSASVMALAKAGRADDRARIEKASTFLCALQADEGEGYSSNDRYYGGVGYGGDERPDLSNLQMALEALHTAGVPSTDPAFQKALAFLQRCQNRSESNDLTLETNGKTFISGNDGGANYAPGESKAGTVTLADGKVVARSYGSMTYALLKGYLFAGLSKDDARVQAVWKWLRENYTLDVNPGFEASDDPSAAYQGLFYYFHTMAKALDLYDEPSIVDAAGTSHDWRAELCGRLVAMQRQDGSWVNENAPRWFEGNPVLATSYAMLSLGIAQGAP